MRNLRIFLQVFFLTVVFFSCKKKESNDEEIITPTTSNAFKATSSSGQTWLSSSVSATYQYGVLVINAKASNGSSILLRLKPFEDYETTVPYCLQFQTQENAAIYKASDTASSSYSTNAYYNNYSCDDSQINLTTFDKTTKSVSGTFYFTAFNTFNNDSISFNSGSFTNIVYSDVTPPTPDNLLITKIDNVTWSAATVMTTYSSWMGISIAGTNSNKTVGIYLPSDATVGTHSTSQWGDYRIVYNSNIGDNDPNLIYNANSGEIIITEFNKDAKYIKGTFAGIVTNGYNNTFSFTNGEFVGNY